MPFTILAVIKVSVCSASLIYASIVDLKTREVSNWLWIVTYPLGLALTFCDRNNVFLLVVSVTITMTLGVALFYLNLSGGADVKALIMVSLFLPSDPSLTRLDFNYVLPTFPLSVFFNSVIFSMSLPITIFVRNLNQYIVKGGLFEGFEEEPLRKKVVAMFSCLKVHAEDFKGPPFQYLAEKGNKLLLSTRLREEEISSVVKEEVWVSPTIPFIVYVTLGFFAAIFLGDIALWFFFQLIR